MARRRARLPRRECPVVAGAPWFIISNMNEQERDEIPGGEFAFPKERKEPIHDAAHVRNAIARFNQVEGVTDEERDEAWKRIKHAAAKFNVELNESSWRDLRHSGKR